MARDKKAIMVNIFGTEYPIEADADPEYIKKVARYVDSKMREITSGSATKVAIQAALNLADELFREKGEKEALISQVNDRATKLTESLYRELRTG